MAKRVEVHSIKFLCETCGKSYSTEEEANRCAVADKLRRQLFAIDENSDFEYSPEGSVDDLDVEDSELTTEPEDATSIDQIKSVTISERVRGWQNRVYTRKEMSNGH